MRLMRRAVSVYDFVRQSHGDGGNQKAGGWYIATWFLLFREIGRIDERLQQMDRQNADNGHRQFDISNVIQEFSIRNFSNWI